MASEADLASQLVEQVRHVLAEAVAAGRRFRFVIKGGSRELPPVAGKDGRLYSRSEPNGGCVIRITVKPDSTPPPQAGPE